MLAADVEVGGRLLVEVGQELDDLGFGTPARALSRAERDAARRASDRGYRPDGLDCVATADVRDPAAVR